MKGSVSFSVVSIPTSHQMKIPLKLVTKSEREGPQGWSLGICRLVCFVALIVTEAKGPLWEEVKWVLPANREGEVRSHSSHTIWSWRPNEL